jgi:hypothetical protein
VAETGADPSMAIKKLKTRGFGSGSPASALVLSLIAASHLMDKGEVHQLTIGELFHPETDIWLISQHVL